MENIVLQVNGTNQVRRWPGTWKARGDPELVRHGIDVTWPAGLHSVQAGPEGT